MKWSTEETYVPYFQPCHEGIYSQGSFVYCALSVLVNIQPMLHIHLLSTWSRPQCDAIESHSHYHHHYYTQATEGMKRGPPWSLCLIVTDALHAFLHFYFSLFVQTGCGATQPPIEWVPSGGGEVAFVCHGMDKEKYTFYFTTPSQCCILSLSVPHAKRHLFQIWPPVFILLQTLKQGQNHFGHSVTSLSSKLTSWSLESLASLRPLSTLVTLDARTPRESRWSWFPNGSLQTSPHNERLCWEETLMPCNTCNFITGDPGDPAIPSIPRSPGGPGGPSLPLSPLGPAGPWNEKEDHNKEQAYVVNSCCLLHKYSFCHYHCHLTFLRYGGSCALSSGYHLFNITNMHFCFSVTKSEIDICNDTQLLSLG